MNPDTMQIVQIVPDTLKILSGNNSLPNYSINPGFFVVIGALIGAFLTIIGNIIVARYQASVQIKNTFFQRRLDTYSHIVQMSWEGRTVINRIIEEENGDYPQAYNTFESLTNWLNSMVEEIDKNIFYLDPKTRESFNLLNWKILEHIRVLMIEQDKITKDKKTRDIGRLYVNDIQGLSGDLVNSARQYMNKMYGLNIE